MVIDSIAALARADFSRDQLVERQQALGAQAARLKRLAEAFRIPILVTNQAGQNTQHHSVPRRVCSQAVPPAA